MFKEITISFCIPVTFIILMFLEARLARKLMCSFKPYCRVRLIANLKHIVCEVSVMGFYPPCLDRQAPKWSWVVNGFPELLVARPRCSSERVATETRTGVGRTDVNRLKSGCLVGDVKDLYEGNVLCRMVLC